MDHRADVADLGGGGQTKRAHPGGRVAGGRGARLPLHEDRPDPILGVLFPGTVAVVIQVKTEHGANPNLSSALQLRNAVT